MFLPTPGALVANRFRLRHAIGKGGMGQVWEAHDKELDGPCAVKFIVDHLAQDPEARLRMVREARAVARLRSPHVVSISSVGEHEGAMYLAMELLEGEPLSNRLERQVKLDATTTLALLEQIVHVLDKAHASNIIHRDLKPDNIWITAEPKLFVKVLDFGIVKSTLKIGAEQTASGALMGTPQYMSPEQANGEREVDHRSDLWALAIIAMECLSGRRPFESTGLGELLMKIMTSAPPPVQALDPALPASLGPWWQRALARDPNQRFQNAADLVHGLRLGLATAVGRGPSLFERTEVSSWLQPPVPATPMRGQTLVTNITPTPISSAPPTPPLPLEKPATPLGRTERVEATPPRTTREPGVSVGPVTHTAELPRPAARRRGLVYTSLL
jgi:serine/threonine protein kinase